jgi:hypothetical protein
MKTKRKYTKERLKFAVEKSRCFADVFRVLDTKPSGNTYQIIKQYIKEDNIDISHFLGRKAGWVIAGLSSKIRHFSEILQPNQKRRVKSHLLRRALKESGELYICKICKLEPKWNGRDLRLHVDHVNGDWSDCRKENLRFLCPNCHSQVTIYNPGKNDK